MNDNSEHEILSRTDLLERLGGDEKILNEVVTEFIQDFPRQIEQMKSALKDSDLRLLSETAHTLKGASGNVSAESIREIASQIENSCRNGDLRDSEELIAKLNEQFERLKAQLADMKVPVMQDV